MVEIPFYHLHHLNCLYINYLRQGGGDGGDVLEKIFLGQKSRFSLARGGGDMLFPSFSTFRRKHPHHLHHHPLTP